VIILVTGGAGFIGSNFIEGIIGSGYSTISLDNLSYGSGKSGFLKFSREHYKFVRGSITDAQVVAKLIEEVDFVVNFAAQTHVDRSIADGLPFIESNTIGVLTLLEAMRRSSGNKRLLQVSTDEVYGDKKKGSFTEQGLLSPSSPYAASKASADLLCKAFHRTYGVNVVISRCTNNFGPRQYPEKLIPKTIIRAKLGLRVPVYGKGTNIRDWIYVEDHCKALEEILRKGKKGEVYNISSGIKLENLEVASTILELMGKPDSLIERVEDRPGHDFRYSLDSSKIRTELGWKPKHPFRAALAKTVEWYMKNEAWWRSLADERVLHPTPWKLKW
jgi:dTDP-glucose 4,6-dehydratase